MDDQNFLLKHKEDSITDSNTDNSLNQALPKQELKTYVTKIDDIDLPSVIIKDIESYENKGWREKTANLSDYFNYGFNEETWKKYSEKIMSKLNELRKAVEENRITLIQKDLIKYLFNLPADYGGIGEILDEKKYENLNFFEYKPSKNKQLPMIEVRQGSMCVTLERNENIIINYNPPTNVNNFSSINSNITGSTNFPVTHPNLKSYPPVNLSTPMSPYFNPTFIRPPGMEIPMPYQFFLQRQADYERTLNITNISQYSPYFNLKSSEEKQSKERRDDSVSSKNTDRRKRKRDKKKKHKRSRSTSRDRSRSKKRSRRSRSKKKRSRSRSKDRSRKDRKRY